jgi:hypothetical protein
MARIETTPAVKVALYALRVYLIILLLLIVVKFLRLFPAHPNPPKKTAAVMKVVGTPSGTLTGASILNSSFAIRNS